MFFDLHSHKQTNKSHNNTETLHSPEETLTSANHQRNQISGGTPGSHRGEGVAGVGYKHAGLADGAVPHGDALYEPRRAHLLHRSPPPRPPPISPPARPPPPQLRIRNLQERTETIPHPSALSTTSMNAKSKIKQEKKRKTQRRSPNPNPRGGDLRGDSLLFPSLSLR